MRFCSGKDTEALDHKRGKCQCGERWKRAAEFLLGQIQSRGVPVPRPTPPLPPAADASFWQIAVDETPDAELDLARFQAAAAFLAAMDKEGQGESFEAGQTRVPLQVIVRLAQESGFCKLVKAGK